MKEEIEEAQEFILDRPEEAALIYWAFNQTDEIKKAFLIAWSIQKDEVNENNESPMQVIFKEID